MCLFSVSAGEPSLSIDGQHQPQSLCSELDSALLLGNQRVSGPGPGANVANVGNNGTSKRQSQHVPIPVPHLPSAAASILSSRLFKHSDHVIVARMLVWYLNFSPETRKL